MLHVARAVITGSLLILSWQHSHWSVALLLTTLYLNSEINALYWRKVVKR